MTDEIKTLLLYKPILKSNEVLLMFTKNKEKGWSGVASFCTNGEDMIRVNEGASDGSNDSNMTYEDFIKNYDYKIGMEGDDYYE